MPMIDLLDKMKAVHRVAVQRGEIKDPEFQGNEIDSQGLDSFFLINKLFDQRNLILGKIKRIKTEIIPLSIEEQRLATQSSLAGRDRSREKHEDNIGTLVNKVQKWSKEVDRALNELEQTNKLIFLRPGAQGTTYMNLREQQWRWLRRKWAATLAEFKHCQEGLKDQRFSALERQYRIVNPSATPKEIEALRDMPTDAPTPNFYAMTLKTEDARTELQRILDRRTSMERIEKKMGELAGLFAQMQEILSEQQEPIEAMQTQVVGTIEQLMAANQHLTEGVQYQRNIRKLRCSIG